VPQPAVAGEDGTTRYLCAAAQLDPDFGDRSIAEYLVERVRAVPPSPGVDSAAVLREAVAARARRRLRDGVLLLLLLMFAVTSPGSAVLWLIVALVGASITGAGKGISRRTSLVVLAVTVCLFVVLQMGSTLLSFVFLDADAFGQLPATGFTLTATLGLLILTVLAADTFAVSHLVNNRFQRGEFKSDAQDARSELERTVRGLGHGTFRAELNRVAAADEGSAQGRDQADVIVHRGPRPFIGAGLPIDDTVVALPLEPAPDASGRPRVPRGISVNELHQHVADALAQLKAPSSLAPSRRLEGLIVREQVLIPADRLVMNLSRRSWPPVLGDLRRPPAAHLPLGVARQLADAPQEWARYYRCFRIEAWDRDLATSCYFFAGTDQHMLYLEWTHCALLPIRQWYRRIDRPGNVVGDPLIQSLADWVLLPATVARRLRSVFHRFRPIVQRPGEVVPDRYGAAGSLREFAADEDVQSYFQAADTVRYVKIVDAALFRAVGQYLESHGYSVVEFQKVANQTITNNTTTISGGTFKDSAVGSGTNTRTGASGPSKGTA